MEAKTFEIRDSDTFIPVLATRLAPSNEGDRFLIARAGYPRQAEQQGLFVILLKLEGNDAEYDPNCWNGRTIGTAHHFIKTNWFVLESGAVIDVEYILGERDQPKLSERLTAPALEY